MPLATNVPIFHILAVILATLLSSAILYWLMRKFNPTVAKGGAVIIAVIAKALPLVGIDAIAQNLVKGAIILFVVVLNVITQRTMDKQALMRREM